MNGVKKETGMDLLKKVSPALDITHTQIAAMLMVTERSLYDWAKRAVDELPPKGHRLARLAEVVDELRVVMPKFDVSSDRMLAVLNDGTVPINYDADSDTSMTLISYITAFPEDRGWRANVTAAVMDYKEYVRALSSRESSRSAAATP